MVETTTTHARYYDELFSNFDYANSLQLARAICILDAVLATGVAKPRILDLGCGSGWLSNLLATFGPTLGVDQSSHAASVAREQYPRAKFETADILQWDYPAESFDIVVSQEVIEHVEDQQRYLQIASNLIRDDGFLILTTPNAKTMMAMPERERKEWSNQPIENWVTISQLRNLLQRNFRNIRLKTIILGMGTGGSYRLVNSAKLSHGLANVGLGRAYDWMRERIGYGLHIVATARKAR